MREVFALREAFALQKLLTFVQQKYWHIWDINVWNFNDSLTNDVVSFEQQRNQYIHIITTAAWSDALYHIEWVFPDQSITQDAEQYPQDVIQCVRLSYYIDNLLIIYFFLKRNSIVKHN